MSQRKTSRLGQSNSAQLHQLLLDIATNTTNIALKPDNEWFDLFGSAGFVDIGNFGKVLRVAFSDVNAEAHGGCYVEKGGSFKLMIIHAGSQDNDGKTASGVLYMSYDAEGGTRAYDVSAVDFDLPLADTEIVVHTTYGTAQTIADNSRVGCIWIKDDNAGAAAGNMTINSIVLVRQ